MKRILILLCILPYALFSQVTFSKIPLDNQLVSRNINTNKGEVIIDGQVNNISTPYTSIRVKVLRNEILYGSLHNQILNYTNNLASFNFNISIDAELANYSFEIFGIEDGNSTLVKTVNRIVAGDVYIIQGQSNAEAIQRSGSKSANSNQSDFIRVFAHGHDTSDWWNDFEGYEQWHIGQGDGASDTDGNTGQWGLKLAKMILDSEQIPIAIFNGAEQGKSIMNFEKGNLPSLYQNYSQLYYRLDKTNLKDGIRGVFWSQGERDGLDGMSTDDYKNAFLNLKNDWLSDYPSIEKFYLFQTRNCFDIENEQLMQIKEAQRQLAYENPDIHIMTTMALQQIDDDCHFAFTGGYEEFANRIYKLVNRDMYGGMGYSSDIEPPMIKSAYLTDNTTLVVETDAISLTNNSTPISNYILENASNAIISNIQVSGSNIIFTLSQNPGTSATISYYAQESGIGNFITNTNNLELVCFNRFPITDNIAVPVTSIWNGTSWLPSTPDSDINAIIEGNYNATNGNIIANNLTINSGINVDFNNGTTNSVVIHGDLTIDGSFTVGDDESLVMYDDNAIIAGNIIKKESSPARSNKSDLNYWSSPIENADIATVFNNVTPSRIFYYDQSRSSASDPNNDPSGTYWDVWVVGTGKMISGVGYAAEGVTGETGIHKISFAGPPNNGKLSVSLKGNFNDNDLLNDFNFIGNPYPSAIDIDLFLNKNSSVIDQTIYLWAHNTPLNGEDFTSSNYLAYNNMGGTSASSDGVTIPYANFNSGQGFFVRALNSGSIIFDNSMRVIGENDQFYKDADGDGFNSLLDCDDTDPAVNPDASEILYNGIDDDCNPETLDTVDADGDSFNSDIDCDDTNVKIYPGATEIPNNGIDEDCDGIDAIDEEDNCINDISGKLNIEPSKSDKHMFIMEIPNGVIDMNTIKNRGSDFTYSGKATSVKVRAKGHGNKLIVNGTEIKLEKNIRYEFTGNLLVKLVNEKKGAKGKGGEGHWWINIEGSDICIVPTTGNECGNEVNGNLNIEPKKGKKDMFIMETPSGTIDMKFLEKKDSDYTYLGNASSIKIKVKKKNSYLIVNGKEIKLDKKHRYEFTGELSVSLLNNKNKKKKKSKDYWWIKIDGSDICVVLDKKSQNDGDDDDDDDDDKDKSAGSKAKSGNNETKTQSNNEEEKDRIWLDLKTNKGGFSQILIGFTDKATQGFDNGYDALKMKAINSPIDFYSVIEKDKYVIQGLNGFSEDQRINLGFDSNVKSRTISISINRVEGTLKSSEIYLVDNSLNVVHDLKSSDYEFEQTTKGEFNNRFTLQFSAAILSVDDLKNDNSFVVSNTDTGFKINADSIVTQINVYDMFGRLIIKNNPNKQIFNLRNKNIKDGTVIVIQATLENGSTISKKIIKF